MRRKIQKRNETELSFADFANPTVASSSIKAFPSTEDAGRSEAASDVICDEWAFHPFAEVNYGAYKPTIDAGGKLIGISTANGAGTNFFYQVYMNAKVASDDWTATNPKGKNGFVPLFIPWFARPDRTNKWYEQQVAEYSETPHLLAQEYPSSDIDAFLTSGNSYFNKEKIRVQMRNCRPAVIVPPEMKGIVKIWEDPQFGEKYVMGADCAEGRGEDLSGAAIYHYKTMRHVADIHGDLAPDQFAFLVVQYALKYNNAFLNVERNAIGTGVIVDITKTYGYSNVLKYRRIEGELKLGKSAIREYQNSAEYGWPTNKITRPLMLRDLSGAISSMSIVSPDKAFWEECLSFVNFRGKLQAAEGSKDDRVFKHALALQAYKYFDLQDQATVERDTSDLILRGNV
jgi:hypothetical protein